jgi:hypothetical protein
MFNPVFTVAKSCCFAPFAAVSVFLFILLLRGEHSCACTCGSRARCVQHRHGQSVYISVLSIFSTVDRVGDQRGGGMLHPLPRWEKRQANLAVFVQLCSTSLQNSF